MTREQKELLKPHAVHFSDMAAFVVTRDNPELFELLDACKAASATNCGWDTYAAAQHLVREIATELRLRKERAAKAAAL